MTNTTSEKINSIQALNLALQDAMEGDDNVILLGEDVGDKEEGGVMGVTKGLSGRFGDSRVRSTPISEQAIVGAAIGSSIVGMRPVAEIMLMNFTTVAMDMIINHAAKLRFMSGGQTNVPITIRTLAGAGFGNGGQHADYYEAWFAHTPGIKVVTYSNPSDAYGLLRSCIDDEDPCIFIENYPTYFEKGTPPKRGEKIPLGKAHVAREGSDVTVISYGRQMNDALAVAEKLAQENVAVEVVDLRTISPMDTETILSSVARTKRAVVVHEAVKKYGVGAEISSVIHESLHAELETPVVRVGAPYCPVPFASVLEQAYLTGQEKIEAAIRQALS